MGFFKPKELPRHIEHLPQKGRAKAPISLRAYYERTLCIPEVYVYKEGTLPVFAKELGYNCTCVLMPTAQTPKIGEKQPICQYVLFTFSKATGQFNYPQHFIEYGDDRAPETWVEGIHDPRDTAFFAVGERFNTKKGSPYKSYDDFPISYRNYCYAGYFGSLEFAMDFAKGFFTPGPYFGWGFHENLDRCKELQDIFDHGKPNTDEWHQNAVQRREMLRNYDYNDENGECYWRDENGKYAYQYPDYINRLELKREKYRLEHANDKNEYEDL